MGLVAQLSRREKDPLGPFRKFCYLFILPILLWCPLGASSLPPEKLRSIGVDLSVFRLGAFSWNGQVFLGLQPEPDLRKKAKGIGWEVLIFRLLANGQVAGFSRVPIPLGHLEQISLSDDGTQALLLGEWGTKLIKLNPATRELRVLHKHEKGVPGFHLDPLLWYKGGRFYAVGYFYDERQTDQGTYLVALHLEKRGREVFEKLLDMRDVEQKVGGKVRGENHSSFPKLYFVSDFSDTLKLVLYENGTVRSLDEGVTFGVVAAGESHVLYPVKHKNGLREFVLQDVDGQKVLRLGAPNLPLTYPYLSRDGGVVAGALLNYDTRRETFFYGTRKSGYALREIPLLARVPFGTFRLSADGHTFAFLSQDGLVFGKIPES